MRTGEKCVRQFRVRCVKPLRNPYFARCKGLECAEAHPRRKPIRPSDAVVVAEKAVAQWSRRLGCVLGEMELAVSGFAKVATRTRFLSPRSASRMWEHSDGPTWKCKGSLTRKLGWWSRQESNLRPSHCERDALPTELRPQPIENTRFSAATHFAACKFACNNQQPNNGQHKLLRQALRRGR